MREPSDSASPARAQESLQAGPSSNESLPLVLLVDDQPARLLTYESVLSGVGVTCVRALSGEEALGRLLKQSFALILLDVSMPVMDGFETARAIREHPRFEKTPIIFVTGVHVSELDTLRGYEVGAIDYISVPLVPEILRSKVALLVELYKRRAELEDLNRELQLARAQLTQESRPSADTTVPRSVENPHGDREWLAALLDSLNEEVYFTDTNQMYTYANPAAIRQFGHRLNQGLSVGALASSLEILRADGSPRSLEESPPLRSLQGEVIRAEEHLVRNPQTGELRTRQVSSAPVRGASGEIVGAVSVVRDVTDERRIDASLRLTELRSRALLRLSDTLRTITSPIDLAYAASQILGETLKVSRCGYGTIDLVAETITVERDWNASGVVSLAGTLNFREYGSYVDDLKRGETVICPDARLDPRTREHSDRLEALQARAFVNVPLIENGDFVALLFLNHAAVREWTEEELGFIREVAERTRIAVERRRHEEAMAADLAITTLLRDLATREVSDSAVTELSKEILSAAMAIVQADAGTLQLLDVQTQDLYFAATRGVAPALVERFSRVNATSKSPCGVALSSGKRSFVEYDVPAAQDPDGTLRSHFEHGLRFGQSTPLITRSGRALGMISTHWGKRPTISERELRYLDLLSRQTADLVERAQAEQALRVSAQELRDADRRKDEFIAMLAHELRNPLVPIRTAIELLKKTGENPPLLETVRPMMERQVKHMVRLIDGLLDVSRVTSGRMELRRESVSLSTIITGAVEANRDALTQSGLALAVNIGRPDLIVDVDATRFTQILSNLLNNAAKFTPAGGHVSVSDSIDAGPGGQRWLSVSVTDTGVGIDPEQLPRIFDLFAHAETAGRTRQGGLGIGLGLGRRLAEMHGGTLVAQSDGPGRGSTFVLRIPLQEPTTSATIDSQPASALSGLRALVIDDTRDAADVMQMLLECEGAATEVAYDGASGIALARQKNPHVILLDIGMPDMDGYDTCRAIRQLPGQNALIIALTGWGQEEVKQRALQAGFDAHLTKPVEPDKLTELIHQLRGRPGANRRSAAACSTESKDSAS